MSTRASAAVDRALDERHREASEEVERILAAAVQGPQFDTATVSEAAEMDPADVEVGAGEAVRIMTGAPLPAGAACRDVRGRGASAATSLRCSPCAQWRCWRRVLLLLAPVYRHGTSTSSCLVVLARPPTHLHPERLDTMRGAREGRRPVVASVAGRQVGSLFCLAPSNFADTYLSDH